MDEQEIILAVDTGLRQQALQQTSSAFLSIDKPDPTSVTGSELCKIRRLLWCAREPSTNVIDHLVRATCCNPLSVLTLPTPGESTRKVKVPFPTDEDMLAAMIKAQRLGPLFFTDVNRGGPESHQRLVTHGTYRTQYTGL
jgi:hypothetical protein